MFWPPARRPCQTPWCPSHRAVPATRELCYVCPALATGGPGAWPPIAPRRWPAGGGPWCRRAGSRRPPLLAPCFGTCGCTGSGGKRHNFSLNFSLRHEVARLIVWHGGSTRPVVPSTVSYEDVREGNDPYRALGHGTHSLPTGT